MTGAVFAYNFLGKHFNLTLSCGGDSESAFKNTSIDHNFNFRGPFQKNLEIRM